MKVSFRLLSLLLLSSCSFNGLYLKPTRLPELPANKDKVTITTRSKNDTNVVEFNTKTLQPTFLTTRRDTMTLDYTIESVQFKSLSGNLLNGWFIKPKGVTANITLLHIHGNAGFILTQYQAMIPLLKHGFQAFVFDYSGFGFSKGNASRDNVLLDANAALQYIKARPEVVNTPLVIYGQSLGGHLSAVVASQNQSLINALVIEGAFSSHKDIAAKSAGFLGRLLVKEKYSALQALPKYTKPLLIIHSTEDEVIPFKLGEKLFAKGNQPKLFYEIKHPHICGPEFYADSIATKIKQLLK